MKNAKKKEPLISDEELQVIGRQAINYFNNPNSELGLGIIFRWILCLAQDCRN